MKTLIKNSNKMFFKPITCGISFVIKKEKVETRPLFQANKIFYREKHIQTLCKIFVSRYTLFIYLFIFSSLHQIVLQWSKNMNERNKFFGVQSAFFFFCTKSQYPSTFRLCVNECVCIVCMNY